MAEISKRRNIHGGVRRRLGQPGRGEYGVERVKEGEAASAKQAHSNLPSAEPKVLLRGEEDVRGETHHSQR